MVNQWQNRHSIRPAVGAITLVPVSPAGVAPELDDLAHRQGLTRAEYTRQALLERMKADQTVNQEVNAEAN
jgi:hypothetical protein